MRLNKVDFYGELFTHETLPLRIHSMHMDTNLNRTHNKCTKLSSVQSMNFVVVVAAISAMELTNNMLIEIRKFIQFAIVLNISVEIPNR